MNEKQFARCVKELKKYSDREAYISDICSYPMWETTQDEKVTDVSRIWDAAHRNVKDISELAGISQRKMAERFGIPYRTMENWSEGKRKCPVYVLLMMQECMGIINPYNRK